MSTKTDNQVLFFSDVKITHDYSQFKILTGNRDINSHHVKRLTAAFGRRHLFTIIICNEKMEVIDGQHRLTAAEHLGLPIYYIMVHGYGLDEVQILNANARDWKKDDVLRSFADRGNKDYMDMVKFMEDHPEFGMKAVDALLTDKSMGSEGRDGNHRKNDFKDGEFKIDSLERAYQNAYMLRELKPYFSEYSRTTFVQAMVTIFKTPNYKHEWLLKKLSINPSLLHPCRTISEYKLLIEKVYNHYATAATKISIR